MSLSVLGLLLSSLSVAVLPQEPSGSPLLAEERFGSALWVSLASVKARILDEEGVPISDLKLEDLRVRVGRSTMPVVAIDYYDEAVPPEAAADEKVAEEVLGGRQRFFSAHQISARGQLFVFFVDADPRIKLPGTSLHLRRLADSLPPSAPAAVVSLDTCLKMQVDLTEDRDALFEALVKAGERGTGALRPAVAQPISLWQGWDEAAAGRARRTDTALSIASAALDTIPGEKVLIYLAEGAGHFKDRMTTSRPSPGVQGAARALREARATFFALHEPDPLGYPALKYLTLSTGGAYHSTSGKTKTAAVDALMSQTRAYHVISFRLPPATFGAQPLTVELVGREGKILAPSFEVLRARR
jgi:hypothetical protein